MCCLFRTSCRQRLTGIWAGRQRSFKATLVASLKSFPVKATRLSLPTFLLSNLPLLTIRPKALTINYCITQFLSGTFICSEIILFAVAKNTNFGWVFHRIIMYAQYSLNNLSPDLSPTLFADLSISQSTNQSTNRSIDRSVDLPTKPINLSNKIPGVTSIGGRRGCAILTSEIIS